MKNIRKIQTLILLGVFALSSSALAATLKISTKGEQLFFDKAELTVKAGEEVTLTFDNASTGMPHNWVLVKPGTQDKVAQDSIKAGADKGWLALGPSVLAHTKMVDGKKSDTIKFKAPAAPGNYPYICTFPGHASIMKGILKVIP